MTLLLAGVIVLIGAAVQGVLGYGLNLLAGPILTGARAGAGAAGGVLHAVMAGIRERGHVEWPNVWWGLAGRIPGNVLGVLVLAMLPVRGFNLVVALSVLLCVALSLMTWKPVLNRPTLVIADVASGAFGTTSAVGGPPIALLYQNAKGPTVRATLGVYFLLSSLSSVATLLIAGQVHPVHLVAVGFALSDPLRRFVEGPRLRAGILGVAALAAVFLLVSNVL